MKIDFIAFWFYQINLTLLWVIMIIGKSVAMAATEDSVVCPEFNLSLYNNPKVSGHLYNPTKKEEIQIEARPWLELESGGLNTGGKASVHLEILGPHGNVLLEKESAQEIVDGAFRWELSLEFPLREPRVAVIRIAVGDREWQQCLPIKNYRLFGRITDFEGRPIEAYVTANGLKDTAAKADKNGYYELWLPRKRIPAFTVVDENYAHSKLEVWVYDYTPTADLELDFHIGQLELYELHAWQGFTGIKIDFVPMSMGLTQQALEESRGDMQLLVRKILGEHGYKPRLRKEDVQVYVNGEQIEVEAFYEREEPIPDSLLPMPLDFACSRPEYILQTAPVQTGRRGEPLTIRVVVSHRYEREGKLIVERGEAYFLGLLAGLSVSGWGN